MIWLKGLFAAALGGAATAGSGYLLSGQSLNGRTIGVIAGAGALAAVVAYLKQSPIQAK